MKRIAPFADSFLVLQSVHRTVLRLMLNDLPGLLFFTTYTLLVLFWAEIYHQAKSQSTAKLRPTFLATNVFVYVVQVTLLVSSAFSPVKEASRVRLDVFQLSCGSTSSLLLAMVAYVQLDPCVSALLMQVFALATPWLSVLSNISPLVMQLTASWFLVLVSLVAAVGFMVYGGRLVAMLCRFPLESRGRTKKMHEVRCIFQLITFLSACKCTSNVAGQLE